SERQEWYDRFTASRSPPFSRPIPPGTVSEGYVYTVGQIQLRELEEGARYFLHCYFYDGEANIFFGSDGCSMVVACHKKTLIFNEEFYFHAPVISAVHIVMEVVKERPGDDGISVAWSVLEMSKEGQALPYFGQHQHAPTLKQKLYPGSPMFLLLSKSLGSYSGLEGVVETRLLSHQHMSAISDFFPEYYIVTNADAIP
ncbi:hypothetical protein PFISCL1PPCAC_70, partial [Pristionchus fissidentatus]